MTAAPRLRTVIRRYGYTEPLLDGRARSARVTLDFQPVDGALRNAMTRMARDCAYDLCEMSPTSYLMARLAGAPLTALPVFPFRQFPLDQVIVRADGPVVAPADLAGARIGMRTWAQPTGLWIREILASLYGCDLSQARWTLVAEDPVAGAPRPPGTRLLPGRTLEDLLASGEIDAAFGLHRVPPGGRPLLGDPTGLARTWYQATGLIPANHLLVMRADRFDPELGQELCRLFDAARACYLADIRAAAADPVIAPLRAVTGLADPLPNGWAANLPLWRTLAAAAARQGMITDPADARDLLERCSAVNQ